MMKFETKVSDDAAYLRDSSIERQNLFRLLECYWGKGDGSAPPMFIQEAAELCGYPLGEGIVRHGRKSDGHETKENSVTKEFAIIPVDSVKVGTKLISDGGFTCLYDQEIVTVEADADGELFIRCSGGENGDFGKPGTTQRKEQHMLDGQLDDEGKNYVGFWLKP